MTKIRCKLCAGTGEVELTGIYAETLTLLENNSGLNGAQLAAKAGCKATAMNQRLIALRSHGLAIGVPYGRQITWFADSKIPESMKGK